MTVQQLALGETNQPAAADPEMEFVQRKADWVELILDVTAGHRLPDSVLNRLAHACMQRSDAERGADA